MYFTDDRYNLQVEITSKECQIPEDERARMHESLEQLGKEVEDLADSALAVTIVYHPQSKVYNAQLKLTVPGKSLRTADEDPYLDSAFHRSLRKLLQKLAAYKEQPDRRALEIAEKRKRLADSVVSPEGPDVGPLSRAYRDRDYRAFRIALAGYEEWLRDRIGRWVQRYPDAQAQIGKSLLLGDILEEVYLNAFERYERRQPEVPLHEWLDSLIDPSLKALMFDPDEEKIACSYARTVRQTPMP